MWAVANSPGQAVLQRSEFHIAMRAVALAQAGEASLTLDKIRETATRSVPMATLKGVPHPPVKNSKGKKPIAVTKKTAPAKNGAAVTTEAKGATGKTRTRDGIATAQNSTEMGASSAKGKVGPKDLSRKKVEKGSAKRPRPKSSSSSDSAVSTSSAAASDGDDDNGTRSKGDKSDHSSRTGEGRARGEHSGDRSYGSGGSSGGKDSGGADGDSSGGSGSTSSSNGGSSRGSEAVPVMDGEGREPSTMGGTRAAILRSSSPLSSSTPLRSSDSMSTKDEKAHAEEEEGLDAFAMSEKARAKYQVRL